MKVRRDNVLGFIVWSAVGTFLIGIGISAFFAKKEVGFWANVKVEEMKDVKKYNFAVGRLFIIYGIIFIVLGLPLLGEQNSFLILFSSIGVMMETIAVMVIYTLIISPKYRKK